MNTFLANINIWLTRWLSTQWFLLRYPAWARIFGLVAASSLIVGLIWGLGIAPEERYQGNSYRIIFIHVPAAITSQFIYFSIAISGGVFLIWRIKLARHYMLAASHIGVSLALLTVATGCIWGRPTWGTWWFPDARVISTLVLVFLFLGIINLYAALKHNGVENATKASSLLAIIGVINLPIIKYSVVWWNSLHQSATFTLSNKPTMPIEMWLPLFIMVIGFYSFFFWSLLHRMVMVINDENMTVPVPPRDTS